ncbi:hypothetical protein T4E_12154 [Trichinella pseudospiralis]|uniref:Uncharacterized protein n=1 Tax=Trichinella pseudospiralis TaxID=6337 RepID=A0A0V0YJB5_TRIPS|nr:hypothetical protein T4E_12154 [Trichinella pseudospiralis]
MVDAKPDQNVPVLSFNLVMDILSKVEKFCRQEEPCKNVQRELDTMVEQNLFFLRASNDSEAESLKIMDEHVFVTAVLKFFFQFDADADATLCSTMFDRIFLPQERLEFRQAVLKQILPLLMLTAIDLDCVPVLQAFVPWMIRGCGGQPASWLKGCTQKVMSTYLCADEMDEYVARLAKMNTSCPTFAHTLLPLMINEQEYFEMLPLSALQLAADWLNEDPESVAKTIRLCLPPSDQSSQKLTLNYVDKLSWLCIVHDLSDDEQARPVMSKLRLGILKLMMRINEGIAEKSPTRKLLASTYANRTLIKISEYRNSVDAFDQKVTRAVDHFSQILQVGILNGCFIGQLQDFNTTVFQTFAYGHPLLDDILQKLRS